MVYFDRRDREKGESKWTFAKKFKLVMDSLMSFSYVPIRFMSLVGLLFNIGAVILFVSVLAEYFTKGTPIAGWPSLMCGLVLFRFDPVDAGNSGRIPVAYFGCGQDQTAVHYR